ncbi:MAG: hypothetical protein IIA17_04500 [candidate division Zixibacteria bacterium]|nr:hypothetical protein [candidate division Zixibacteria bacterium]
MISTAKSNQLSLIRMIAIAMLIVMPVIFLVSMFIVSPPKQSGGEIEIMFLILLVVGMLQPLAIPIIEKIQIQNWLKEESETKSPAALFVMLSIIKSSFIEGIYIYGLVVYFLSGDMIRALYFYPIGIVWSVVHWPTRQRFENFVSRLSEQ